MLGSAQPEAHVSVNVLAVVVGFTTVVLLNLTCVALSNVPEPVTGPQKPAGSEPRSVAKSKSLSAKFESVDLLTVFNFDSLDLYTTSML